MEKINLKEIAAKHIITEPKSIRWNIIEDEGYMGDEWDTWNHLDEEERNEQFKKMFTYFKSLKDGYASFGKEVWELAVDKCKENAAVINMQDEYGVYGELDEKSIDVVKQMIL